MLPSRHRADLDRIEFITFPPLTSCTTHITSQYLSCTAGNSTDMPPPFVDRMATIQETIDNPSSSNMAQQQGPGYKLVRVAEANPRPNNMFNGLLRIMSMVVEVLFLRPLRCFQLWQIVTYVRLLVQTSLMNSAGISPKLFAFSQFLDMSEYYSNVGDPVADLRYQSPQSTIWLSPLLGPSRLESVAQEILAYTSLRAKASLVST